MKQLSVYCVIAFSLLILMFSCKKENVQKTNNIDPVGYRDAGGSAGGDATVSAMLYTQDVLDAGTILISNDVTNISVTFTTLGDYTFTQTDLYIGDNNNVPKTSQCVALPTSFPYRTSHSNGITSYTYLVPVGSLYNIGGCGNIAAHAVVKRTDSTGATILKDVWSAGVAICSNTWATSTPYCLSGYALFVPQPCPISFKRNNGQGTCGGDGQIRVSFQTHPEDAPLLDSIYYEGSKIANRTYSTPDLTSWAQKGYVSYCILGGNLPPAKKLVLFFSYSNHQVCSVNE